MVYGMNEGSRPRFGGQHRSFGSRRFEEHRSDSSEGSQDGFSGEGSPQDFDSQPVGELSESSEPSVGGTLEDGVLQISPRTVVVPGEVLARGLSVVPGSGTYRSGEDVLSLVLGLADVQGKVVRVIPLSGKYFPKVGDRIVARVFDVLLSGWRLEFGSAYSAVLNVKDATSRFIEKGEDLRKLLDIGEYVVGRIVQVSSQNLIDVTTRGPGLGPANGGRIVMVSPSKVPRIIGKDGSMILLLKELTGCSLTVGQNGWVWLDGTPDSEIKALKALREIEVGVHLQGLTDHVKKFLEGLQ